MASDTSKDSLNKQWMDQPFDLIYTTGVQSRTDIPRDHYAITLARNMALGHNMILRGFNAIYNQCLSVTKGTAQAKDMLIFSQCMFSMLKSHHDMEEEHFFPLLENALEKPGLMAVNVQEHKDFEEALHQFQKYVFDTGPTDFDGKGLQSLIEGFRLLLQKHLHSEIATMLDLHVADSKVLKNVWKRVAKEGLGPKDMYRTERKLYTSVPYSG
ncbi:hypothetical protein B7463_g7680, partial [Scytalidium lignicola]